MKITWIATILLLPAQLGSERIDPNQDTNGPEIERGAGRVEDWRGTP
jgi:hypothetical protein